MMCFVLGYFFGDEIWAGRKKFVNTPAKKNALFFEIVVVERVLVVGGEQCEHVRGSSRRRRRLMVLVVVEKVRRAREKKGVARAAKNRWS